MAKNMQNINFISQGGASVMTMADRIQSLRKTKGISQEELADQIGVSRQAVSKWESEQSNPDLEKVILLSEYFEVTTDYLLKGIEPKPDSNIKNRHDARLYMLLGTAINFIGLTSALMVWIEQQREYSVAIGLILFAVGCLIYAVGQLFGSNKTAAKKWFIGVNIWILLFIPLNCIFQFIIALIHRSYYAILSPLPQFYGNSVLSAVLAFGLFLGCYIAVCVLVDVMVFANRKNKS